MTENAKAFAELHGDELVSLDGEARRKALTAYAIPKNIQVLHDDLLATGGTMAACYELVKSMNPRKIYINFIVELSALNGRKNLPADADVRSLIVY